MNSNQSEGNDAEQVNASVNFLLGLVNAHVDYEKSKLVEETERYRITETTKTFIRLIDYDREKFNQIINRSFPEREKLINFYLVHIENALNEGRIDDFTQISKVFLAVYNSNPMLGYELPNMFHGGAPQSILSSDRDVRQLHD